MKSVYALDLNNQQEAAFINCQRGISVSISLFYTWGLLSKETLRFCQITKLKVLHV